MSIKTTKSTKAVVRSEEQGDSIDETCSEDPVIYDWGTVIYFHNRYRSNMFIYIEPVNIKTPVERKLVLCPGLDLVLPASCTNACTVIRSAFSHPMGYSAIAIPFLTTGNTFENGTFCCPA